MGGQMSDSGSEVDPDTDHNAVATTARGRVATPLKEIATIAGLIIGLLVGTAALLEFIASGKIILLLAGIAIVIAVLSAVVIWMRRGQPGVRIGAILALGFAALLYLAVKLYDNYTSTMTAPRTFPFSADGRFRADTVQENGVHYRVVDVPTGRTVLTTRPAFGDSNPVKAGHYCGDGRFLAAYHYGHEGNYTWIGVWGLDNGQLRDYKRIQGYTRDLSNEC